MEDGRDQKRRRRHCLSGPLSVARQARRRARQGGMGVLMVHLLSLSAFVGAIGAPPPVPLPARPPRPSRSSAEGGLDRPPNEYERGGHAIRARHGHGRYASRPSLARLIRDARRPAARHEAGALLLAQIPDEVTREWAAGRLAEGDVNALARHVRPALDEGESLVRWQQAAREARPVPGEAVDLSAVARALLALANGGDDGARGFRP